MMGLAVKQLLAGDAEGEEGGCLPAIMKILSTIKQSGDVLVRRPGTPRAMSYLRPTPAAC